MVRTYDTYNLYHNSTFLAAYSFATCYQITLITTKFKLNCWFIFLFATLTHKILFQNEGVGLFEMY